MRTRTLLLLSVATGLAILLAGVFLLLRLDGGGSEVAPPLAIGQSAVAGDLRVTVTDAVESDGLLVVTVELSGVDDPDALDTFRLVVPGGSIEPVGATRDGGCRGATVAPQRCTIAFGVADVDGGARVLVVRRGEDQHRWALA
jgi:hypothetical protein